MDNWLRPQNQEVNAGREQRTQMERRRGRGRAYRVSKAGSALLCRVLTKTGPKSGGPDSETKQSGGKTSSRRDGETEDWTWVSRARVPKPKGLRGP